MKNLTSRARNRLDEKLDRLRPAEGHAPPPKGWIRALRDALGMSGAQLGKRLGVTQQTIEAMEKSEAAGTIQLQTLRRAAEALGSQLVYAIVPDMPLEDLVRTRARQMALRALARVSQTMKLEGQATGAADLEARIDDFIRNELNDRDLWSEG